MEEKLCVSQSDECSLKKRGTKMSIQQRKQILQILYEMRAQEPQTLDRDVLIQRMAVCWDEIRHEVAYLEEHGYVEVKKRQIGIRIFERLRITAKGVDLIEDPITIPNAPVLLVTATEVEALAVLNLLQKEPDYKFERRFIEDKTYYNLGIIGEVRIFMVQSEMGAGGPGGSLLTVQAGIQALTPTAVVMVGTAFGIDPRKQHIGDILVSRQILNYELQRIGTDSDGKLIILPRGARPEAPARLLDRFRGGLLDWQGPKVQFGLILSGEKLIDNPDFRDQLRKLEPEAIGGEMEGAGLYAAAHRNKIDWILVKAICDWADGRKHQNKNSRQQKAAQNAARFTLHVIRQGGFIEDKANFGDPTLLERRPLINSRNNAVELLQFSQLKNMEDPPHRPVQDETKEASSAKLQIGLPPSETTPYSVNEHSHISSKSSLKTRLAVYISYAPEDEPLRVELEKQLGILQQQGFIDVWHNRQISAGLEWRREIEMHLNTARIILLLVSPDFIASENCFGVEMKLAMERQKYGEAYVIPILLRPTAGWRHTPFGELQALPRNRIPVTSWASHDQAFAEVAEGIQEVVESISLSHRWLTGHS